MKQSLNLNTARFWLFASLLVAAPLSKYPSVAMPVYNFTSFRIGLYPILSLLFVLFSAKELLYKLPALYRWSRLSIVSTAALGLVSLVGLGFSLSPGRSLLLAASILLLLALVLTAWWYVAFELAPEKYKKLLKWVLIAGCVYGVIGMLQFVFAGFGHQTFGLLCTNCSASVFGFPRINGFTAEPQFFANALMIYFFVGVGAFYHSRSRLSLATSLLTLLAIGLTFSRGAFLAVAIGLVTFFVLLVMQKALRPVTILKHVLMGLAATMVVFGLFVAASSYRYRNTPDIAYKTFRSLVQQASVGVIKLPASKYRNGEFKPAGLVQASSGDRLTAAKLSIKAWNHSAATKLLGVGAGNLGPFAVKHIDQTAPSNLTVYIYYVLILAELGIVGLAAFSLLNLNLLRLYLKNSWGHKHAAIYMGLFCLGIAFLVQYFFFGTYINVPYVWLWMGILLGLGQKLEKRSIMRGLS